MNPEEAVVAAFTKLLNGFGYHVNVTLTPEPGLKNKQLIADSIPEIGKACASVLVTAGVQMGML